MLVVARATMLTFKWQSSLQSEIENHCFVDTVLVKLKLLESLDHIFPGFQDSKDNVNQFPHNLTDNHFPVFAFIF
jgi:hypothetical protein